MIRILLATSCLAGIVISGAAAAPAYAGPPNQSCQATANSAGQLSTPGHSGSAPGSVFNEPGFGSLNGGTGGTHYNGVNNGGTNPSHGGNGAPSQYDVACTKNQSGNLSPPSAPASTTPAATAPASTAPTATAPTTVKTGHMPHN